MSRKHGKQHLNRKRPALFAAECVKCGWRSDLVDCLELAEVAMIEHDIRVHGGDGNLSGGPCDGVAT